MSRDSGAGGGGSNAGAPTLTTPTLTPTTLRNIEQMFADRDPHEPPHHHSHAAGFVPPIISPSAGTSSYLSLVSTPSNEVAGVSLPDLISPTLAEILPDITNGRINGNNKLQKPPLPLLIQNITSPLPASSSTTLLTASSASGASLPSLVERLASLPPLALKPPIISPPADLTISVRPQNLAEKKERPPSLNLGPLSNGNVINKVIIWYLWQKMVIISNT